MNLNEAAEKFLTDLAMTKVQNTVSSYRTPLNHLRSCCGDVDVSYVKPGVIPEFVRWLHDNNPVSQNTLNLYLTALSRFYHWLVLSELTSDDSLRFKDWVGQYHRPVRKLAPQVPPEDDVQALMECIRKQYPVPAQPNTEAGRNMIAMWLRDRALIETLRSTGCRIGEACSLLVGDVKAGYATIVGKGEKERDIFWDEVAWNALLEYLEFKATDPDLPLFSRHDWKAGSETPISNDAARKVLAEWCRRAHVKVIKPHQFRHRFGKMVTESLGLDKAQDLMGHASPTTTRVYTQNTHKELRGAHGAVNL